MSPSPLDESLLTAYLDGELSEQERTLVEEQLKVNEHWKQMLVELRNVQSLIRELPTPKLSRSLTNGPWSHDTQPNATAGTMERNASATNRRAFPISILAIAASLLLCAVGAFAWMRFDKDDLEVAKMEKNAKTDAMAGDELAAIPTDMKDMAEPSIATSSATESEEAKLAQTLGLIERKNEIAPTAAAPMAAAPMAAAPEKDASVALSQAPKRMLKSRSPMPAAPSELSMQGGIAGPGQARPQIAPRFDSSSPEPVETLIAVREKTPMNAPQGELANAFSFQDKQAAAQEDFLAPSAGAPAPTLSTLQDDRFKDLKRFGRSNETSDQPGELRILRSDLPLVLQQLRELGWVVPNQTNPIASETLSRPSLQRLGEAETTPNEEAMPRPPTLTGVINEPTDWVRILFHDETTN